MQQSASETVHRSSQAALDAPLPSLAAPLARAAAAAPMLTRRRMPDGYGARARPAQVQVRRDGLPRLKRKRSPPSFPAAASIAGVSSAVEHACPALPCPAPTNVPLRFLLAT
jgi:hypothetical protein